MASESRGGIGRGSRSSLDPRRDEKPCATCGSVNHGSGAHAKLEELYRSSPAGSIAREPFRGPTGALSPSMADTVRPDHLQILRSDVFGIGGRSVVPACLRLWKPDVWGGLTCMLSWDEAGALTVARICGVIGSDGVVVLGSKPSDRLLGRRGT